MNPQPIVHNSRGIEKQPGENSGQLQSNNAHFNQFSTFKSDQEEV